MKNQIVELVNQYAPLAQAIANKYKTLPYDDRQQEAMLGLIIAALHYDKAKGHFGPYAKRVIQNRLNMMFNCEIKQPIPVDFAAIEDANDDAQKIPQDVLEIQEERYALIELISAFLQLMTCLKETEKKLLRLRLLGQTQDECAQELNVSQAKVSRMMQRIRQVYDNAIDK